jgi:1-deoxy-D-xylulose 5-phosphate reductoisomerase
MLSANIDKVSNVTENMPSLYDTLTKKEQRKLLNKTIGHGNMKVAEISTRLTRNTIMKAMSGGKVLRTTATTLRNFIN